jgi:hypothetical protein
VLTLFLVNCEEDKVLIDDKGKVNAMASPNALAFDNLSAMANLQSQTNPKSLFFSLRGGVDLDGRVTTGESWGFHYYESQKYFDDGAYLRTVLLATALIHQKDHLH